MKEDWHDPAWARAWDQHVDANPVREEHLDLVVSAIAAAYRPGATILDLGVGSGKLQARLLASLPDARFVGLDSSEVMLTMARERLRDSMDRVVLLKGDFSALAEVPLPRARYSIIVSIQALHHVPDEDKRRVFEWSAGRLSPGGLFVLMDRVAIGRDQIGALARVLLGRIRGAFTGASGWSGGRLVQRIMRDHDHPSTVATHLRLLRGAGFDARCVRQHLDRAVFTAVRRAG